MGNGKVLSYRPVAVVATFAMTAVEAFAQNRQRASMDSIIAGFDRFLCVIMGLGALVSLTFFVYKMIDGQKEAAKKLIWVILGLTLGSFMMGFVASHASLNLVMGEGGGFGAIQRWVKSLMQGAISVVAMIAMASITMQIMHGDETAYRRFFTWVFTLSIGNAILEVIQSPAS